MSFVALFGIIVTIYLFIDAPKRNKNRFIWAIFGFFFSLITLGIYLCSTKRVGWGIFWLAIWGIGIIISIISGLLNFIFG